MTSKFLDQKKKLRDFWKENEIVTDVRVLEAFMKVPREAFIFQEYIEEAYGDYPLQIYEGQTISQPTTVLLMTQALKVEEGMKILEVGSGSGYQSAIMSELVGEYGKIFTVEYLDKLVDFAKSNLKYFKNVEVIKGDGGQGYKKEAPFDRIIVTCAAPHIPPPLLDQLKEDGIIVCPVDSMFGQQVHVLTKRKDGLEKTSLGRFSFVPLQGKYRNK